ncbi:hypothetical protein FF011L_01890 [Roseimaritima multifibrata]|uniref:Uncharacterized protein n=1 Tax=Roseimaritima multifibrata TaxID=1930274 RepID=A0A517M9A5_9BACT|nr:hypothetical protein [Roseimaritima multifibrata]QDS91459.1 hypothetical protein FF011L_01890 [Roseimaritima multifibrata]
MDFAEPTFDTDLDIEGFTLTGAENSISAAEIDRSCKTSRLKSCTPTWSTTPTAKSMK